MQDKIFTLGAPRTGFTLLISIINQILQYKPNQGITTEEQRDRVIYKRLIDISSIYLKEQFFSFFQNKIDMDNFMYNGEFDLLVGGPKWLNQENLDECVIRKYVGIKDDGDFTFLIYLPKKALNYDRVVHSHYYPKSWTEDPYYNCYQKFVSIRNPIGVINSAVFSINAITSEYITNFIKEFNEDEFREIMALYKLTDLDLFDGLVKFLVSYMEELLLVLDNFIQVKWENIIETPHTTIQTIADNLKIDLTSEEIESIWEKLDHVNLPKYHLYNYRKGFGVVGEWRNRLTNHHIKIFEKYNFNKYLNAFGYEPLQNFDENTYNEFQHTVNDSINKGEIYNKITDDNLFKFCWNKSNVAVTSHKFDRFERSGYSQVERSSLNNKELAVDFAKELEPEITDINTMLRTFKPDNFKEVKRLFIEKHFNQLSESSKSKINAYFEEIDEVINREI